MKAESKCKPSQQPDRGLTVEQAMQVHAGWNAAAKGLPLTMSEGQFWSEGWLNHHLFKADPRRSWLRH